MEATRKFRRMAMLSNTMFVALHLSGLFMTLFYQNAIAEGNATVHGIVYDRDSGNPISGAKVTIEETVLLTQTNQFGIFMLSNIHPGTYTLTIESPGFHPIRKPEISIQAGEKLNYSVGLEVSDVNTLVFTDEQIGDYILVSHKGYTIKSVLESNGFLKILPQAQLDYIGGFAIKASPEGMTLLDLGPKNDVGSCSEDELASTKAILRKTLVHWYAIADVIMPMKIPNMPCRLQMKYILSKLQIIDEEGNNLDIRQAKRRLMQSK